jgi:hypothetical protein
MGSRHRLSGRGIEMKDRELIGVKVVRSDMLKHHYLPIKPKEYVSIEVWKDAKYGAVISLHHMKRGTDRLYASFDNAMFDEPEEETKKPGKPVPPDEESMRRTLATNLAVLEVIKSGNFEYHAAQGKASVLYGLLYATSDGNPQIFDNYSLAPYLPNIVKVMDGSLSEDIDKLWESAITSPKEVDDDTVDNLTKFHQDLINNMVLLELGVKLGR